MQEELLTFPGEHITDNYPSEFVSPKDKEKDEYGCQYAKALYATSNQLGSLTFDEIEYMGLMELAQGRQSVEGIKKLFGHYDTNGDGSDSLAYIDPQILNLAPKYINRAVAKMQKYSYDIAVDAVDPVSIEEKGSYAATIQAFYRLKEWVTFIGQDPKMLFPEIDIDSLPQYPDELLYDITVNPKIKKEIGAEIALKLLHYINDFKQKMREVDWWIVVYGKGHLHFYNDQNGVPRVEVINPKYFIGSWVENESYDDQQHAGFLDFITVDQLRKEMLAAGKSEIEIAVIADKWRGGYLGGSSPEIIGGMDSFDGLDYIPVMRFYFKSEDNRRFVVQKNQYDSDILLEKSFNYTPGDDVKEHFEKGERRLIPNNYTSIYGGTWILDTDIVYDYGRKKMPRTNLVEAQLPIISFAPNMKEGRVVSFLSQMKEPLSMINAAWNKIKEIIAKGWMGVREIDFTQLENVSLTKGGQDWTAQDVYSHFLKTNTLLKRSPINRHDQKYSGSAVEDTNSGLQLADYFTTFTTAVNILEQMTSTAVVDSMTVPDRLSATAAKQSAMSADTDMEYLYNAHENLYLKGSHLFLLLLQESLRDGNNVKGFVPALGKVNTGYYEVPQVLAYSEFGLTMSRQPTAEQWADFYLDVREALKNQEISIADSSFLREIDNLKQARQMMAIRNKQYKRQLREDAKFNNDLAIQSNEAAARAKAEFEGIKEDKKGENAEELAILNGKIQERLLRIEKEMDAEIKGVENQTKEWMKRQEGLDSIIKEAMRSRAERYKSDSQLRGTIVSATQKAQSDREKVSAPKLKSTAK